MSDEDKVWLLDMLRQSYMAERFGERGGFTDEERDRWHSYAMQYPDDYIELLHIAKVLYGKKNTITANEA